LNRLYSAFGLVVESTLELPVTNLLGHADGRPADVTVCVHSCLDGSQTDTGAPGSITASPSAVALYWEDVGEYRVSDGRRIDIRPLPGVPAHVLSLFVMGTAFAMLLYQRGYTVLHGSVAEFDGCGIGFLGHKGAGKSTLAMSLQQIGGRLIADDLVAVQMEPEVLALSGFRQMKLWPDSLHHLGYRPDELARLRPELEKRGLPFAPVQRPTAARLRHLFVVQQSEEISIVPLSEKEALLALLPHWYAARFGTAFVRQLQAQATQFMQCVALAREVRVSLLKRPLALAALPRVVEAIGNYIGAPIARGRTRRAAQTQRRAVYVRSNEESR
jgi:hypothetical protein